MIRHGRDRELGPTEYQAIDVFAMIDDLRLKPGETLDDVRARMNVDRIASIIGVRPNGDLNQPSVDAFGEKLFTNGSLGIDLIVVPPGAGFPPHIHPGDHLLLCIAGRGTFTLAGVVHEVEPGYLAMIEGSVPHAVGNPYDQPHVLLAIGSPHKELDGHDRMIVVDWDGNPVDLPHETHVKNGHHSA